MDKDQLRQIALTAGLSSKIIIPLSDDALDPQSTAPSFYCVHAISGAGATDFIDLAIEIGQGVRFFAIQAPTTLWYFTKVLWNLPRALPNDNLGRLGRQLLLKIGNLWTKKKPQQMNDAASHPLQRFLLNFSQYPEYWQAFMVDLHDEIEKTAFLPYDGAGVVYESRTKPILLSGVREFWKSIAHNCEVVKVRATHVNVVNWPQVVPLGADLKQRLTGKVPPPGSH